MKSTEPSNELVTETQHWMSDEPLFQLLATNHGLYLSTKGDHQPINMWPWCSGKTCNLHLLSSLSWVAPLKTWSLCHWRKCARAHHSGQAVMEPQKREIVVWGFPRVLHIKFNTSFIRVHTGVGRVQYFFYYFVRKYLVIKKIFLLNFFKWNRFSYIVNIHTYEKGASRCVGGVECGEIIQ